MLKHIAVLLGMIAGAGCAQLQDREIVRLRLDGPPAPGMEAFAHHFDSDRAQCRAEAASAKRLAPSLSQVTRNSAKPERHVLAPTELDGVVYVDPSGAEDRVQAEVARGVMDACMARRGYSIFQALR